MSKKKFIRECSRQEARHKLAKLIGCTCTIEGFREGRKCNDCKYNY